MKAHRVSPTTPPRPSQTVAGSRPFADYALLGDCHSAALVSRDGCVEWWCPARFDARSVFARLLDPAAGHFSIAPTQPFEDALALGSGVRGHDIGLRSPHVLVREQEATQ